MMFTGSWPTVELPKGSCYYLAAAPAVASAHQDATHRRRENLRSPWHLMALLPAVEDPKQ